jgi:hypothetical protein
VFREVHTSHAAGAKQAEQLVFAQEETLVLPFAEEAVLPGGEPRFGNECVDKILCDWPGGLCPRGDDRLEFFSRNQLARSQRHEKLRGFDRTRRLPRGWRRRVVDSRLGR